MDPLLLVLRFQTQYFALVHLDIGPYSPVIHFGLLRLLQREFHLLVHRFDHNE